MHNIKTDEILLIEDNATDAELAIRVLKKSSLTSNITWLKDGAEALDYIFYTGDYSDRPCQQPPAVILLDLKLPKVDGIEVLNKIKTNELTNSIPVVVFSSSNEEKDITTCYKSGANSYIVKPVDFDSFSETVRKVGTYWIKLNTPPPVHVNTHEK